MESKKARKRTPVGLSLVDPRLKRRKIPKGVDFVNEEREEIQKVQKELQEKFEQIQKERKLIFETNKRIVILNEDVESLNDRKIELMKIVQANDEMCEKLKEKAKK